MRIDKLSLNGQREGQTDNCNLKLSTPAVSSPHSVVRAFLHAKYPDRLVPITQITQAHSQYKDSAGRVIVSLSARMFAILRKQIFSV